MSSLKTDFIAGFAIAATAMIGFSLYLKSEFNALHKRLDAPAHTGTDAGNLPPDAHHSLQEIENFSIDEIFRP